LKRVLIIIILLNFLTLPGILAQSIDTTLSSDSLYKLARYYAFNAQKPKARSVCRYLLNKDSMASDINLLIGNTYSWDGKYDSARYFLIKVVKSKPFYYEAHTAIINVELWDGKYPEAIKFADSALAKFPNDAGFMIKKARALYNLKKYPEAKSVLQKILSRNPYNTDAMGLMDAIGEKTRKDKLTINVSYDYTDPSNINWYYGSIALGRKTSIGTIIGRIAYSNRYNGLKEGFQLEIDGYPTITKWHYLYINLGISPKSTQVPWGWNEFPTSRLGLELYQKLPKAFEASIGIRYLNFHNTKIVNFDSSHVVVYTATLGKYFGNYWISFRPYLTPGAKDWSKSGQLTIRRYFSIAENYLSFTAGAGKSPSDMYDYKVIYVNGQGIIENIVSYMMSVKASVEFQHKLFKWTFGNIGFGYSYEEYYKGKYRSRYVINASCFYVF
jgi:YaiO family outer membrane protein